MLTLLNKTDIQKKGNFPSYSGFLRHCVLFWRLDCEEIHSFEANRGGLMLTHMEELRMLQLPASGYDHMCGRK